MPKTDDVTKDSSPADGRMHDFRFRAMNATVYLRLYGDDAQVSKAKASAVDWFRFAEQRFSRFRPDSELSQLNRASGGHPMMVSDSMLEVLELAKHYARLTEGAFSPFVLGALARSGYDVSFEQMRAMTREAGSLDRCSNAVEALGADAASPASSPMPELLLDPGMKAATLPTGAAIDLGGIVKSWAVQRLADYLGRRLGITRGLVNAGGDLTTWGAPEAQTSWSVGIEHPWEPARNAGTLTLSGRYRAAATSSVLGRSWRSPDGDPRHHLIDPATMRASQSDVVQCTVTGALATECEVWAKVICILGLAEGTSRMRRAGSACEALAFTRDGRAHAAGPNGSLREKRWQAAQGSGIDWMHGYSNIRRDLS